MVSKTLQLTFLATLLTSTFALPALHRRQNENAGTCAAGDTECTAVANAINSWTLDVETVNTFLNDDTTTTGTQLISDAQNALNFANDEPTELGILMATPGLSAAGQAAAMTLMQVFGNVPEDLMEIISGAISGAEGIDQINAVRCPLILPSIATLWQESAAAVGLAPPTLPGINNACNEPNDGITTTS